MNCACGYSHDVLKSTPALWASLAYIGVQRIDADETGPAEAYELRNCPAGGTISVELQS